MSKKKIVKRTLKQGYLHWVESLRSGKYKQADGALKVSHKGKTRFCCLGVLCDLLIKDGCPAEWKNQTGVSSKTYKVEQDIVSKNETINTTELPEFIRCGMNITLSEQIELIEMNDFYKSFNEIADYIESTIMPAALKRQKEGVNV